MAARTSSTRRSGRFVRRRPEIFETGHALLATLGYPLFDPVRKPVAESTSGEIYVCTASGANGRGQFTTEGFVVLEGSTGRGTVVPSIAGTTTEQLRTSLLESGVLRAEGDVVVFTKDHLFRTPSGAAVTLMGRTANGWIDWKTRDGRTLDAVKRQ